MNHFYIHDYLPIEELSNHDAYIKVGFNGERQHKFNAVNSILNCNTKSKTSNDRNLRVFNRTQTTYATKLIELRLSITFGDISYPKQKTVVVLQQGNSGQCPTINLKFLPNFQSRLQSIFGIYKTLTTSFSFFYFAPYNFDPKFRHCVVWLARLNIMRNA